MNPTQYKELAAKITLAQEAINDAAMIHATGLPTKRYATLQRALEASVMYAEHCEQLERRYAPEWEKV